MARRPRVATMFPRPTFRNGAKSWSRPQLSVMATMVETPELHPSWKGSKWGDPPDCRPGSELVDGACKPTFFCPSGFHRNSRTGWCDPDSVEDYKCNLDVEKPFCGPDHYYVRSEGRCVPCPCPASQGFTVNMSGPGCYFRLAGKPCCPGKPLDAPCVSDRVWNEKGECIGKEMPHCKVYGPLAKYNADTGHCDCPSGYVREENPPGCKPQGSVDPPPRSDNEEPSSGAGRWVLGLIAVGAAAVGLREAHLRGWI